LRKKEILRAISPQKFGETLPIFGPQIIPKRPPPCPNLGTKKGKGNLPETKIMGTRGPQLTQRSWEPQTVKTPQITDWDLGLFKECGERNFSWSKKPWGTQKFKGLLKESQFKPC